MYVISLRGSKHLRDGGFEVILTLKRKKYLLDKNVLEDVFHYLVEGESSYFPGSKMLEGQKLRSKSLLVDKLNSFQLL